MAFDSFELKDRRSKHRVCEGSLLKVKSLRTQECGQHKLNAHNAHSARGQ